MLWIDNVIAGNLSRFSVCIGVMLFFFSVRVDAQERKSAMDVAQSEVEKLMYSMDGEEAENRGEEMVSYLQNLAENPVNINSAGINDLLRIPHLNLKNARAIVDYRSNVKVFESVEELIAVSGIGEKSLEKYRPYITVGKGWDHNKRLFSDINYWTHGGQFQAFSRYQRDLENSAGYTIPVDEGGYVGSSVKYYQRFGYGSKHLSWNLTQEKDAGEQLVDPLRFHHQSWHFALRDVGKLKNFVVGDYGLSFGQGLVIGSGLSFGKSPDAVDTYGRGVRAYTSAGESNYFQGAAFTFGEQLQITGFYSDHRLSATVLDSVSTRYPSTSGYKRTINEYRKERVVGQQLIGGRLQHRFGSGAVGITGYQTNFDRYIQPPERLYARYDFSGSAQSSVGLDYHLMINSTAFFGEAARTANGGWGLLTGMESSLGNRTELKITYRNYQKDFQSILAGGFSETSGNPQNEQGLYLGINNVLGKRLTFSGYLDQYYFPHARYGTHQSTEGYEWMGRLEADLTDQLDVYIQYRGEIKDDEFDQPDVYGRIYRRLGNSIKNTYRVNLEYKISKSIRFRSRGELVRNRDAGGVPEIGYLFYQDIRMGFHKKLRLDARLTMFDTESYASRVYQFENDLLYVFSSRMLYEQGQRMYVLVNFEPSRYIEIWGKFGITTWENERSIGSGMNNISGNVKREIGIQARLRF